MVTQWSTYVTSLENINNKRYPLYLIYSKEKYEHTHELLRFN